MTTTVRGCNMINSGCGTTNLSPLEVTSANGLNPPESLWRICSTFIVPKNTSSQFFVREKEMVENSKVSGRRRTSSNCRDWARWGGVLELAAGDQWQYNR